MLVTIIPWTRLPCHSFKANAVRLQLHALAYNLAAGTMQSIDTLPRGQNDAYRSQTTGKVDGHLGNVGLLLSDGRPVRAASQL